MAKNAIVVRGLYGLLDEKAVKDWSEKHGFDLKIFNWEQLGHTQRYIRACKEPIDLIGFSKGAEIVYAAARNCSDILFDRLITIGTYHTVTSSFGTQRRPTLRNIKQHLNFVEKFQQPAGFENNPINIDLGKVEHMKSVSVALKLLDEKYS